MGKYGINSTNSDACIETSKDLKKRIKQRKMILEDFVEMSTIVDMPWEARQQIVGNIYMDIRDMKKRLKRK